MQVKVSLQHERNKKEYHGYFQPGHGYKYCPVTYENKSILITRYETTFAINFIAETVCEMQLLTIDLC